MDYRKELSTLQGVENIKGGKKGDIIVENHEGCNFDIR